mmetsp:Transcript_9076/g.22502  ORF Transcript_9076/g.22502 Transcript_9076/m.22502 type:complete len:352 (+) Transcript_9076:1697-2752(+)
MIPRIMMGYELSTHFFLHVDGKILLQQRMHNEMRMLPFRGNLYRQESGFLVDLCRKLGSMIEQAHERSIVGVVAKGQVQRTVAFAVDNRGGIGKVHQDCIRDRWRALVLDCDRERQISVHVGSRHGTREARQQSLDDNRINNFTTSQQQMQRQVSVFVCALCRRKIFRQQRSDDSNGTVVAACNVKGKPASGVVGWTVHHGVGTFGRHGQQKLDGIHGIIIGSDVNGQPSHLIRVVDTFLVGAVDDFQSRKIVVCRCVVDWKCSHVVSMDQSFWIQHQDHIDEQCPSTGMACNFVECQFPALWILSFCEFRVLVQNVFDQGPVVFGNFVKQVSELGIVVIDDCSLWTWCSR